MNPDVDISTVLTRVNTQHTDSAVITFVFPIPYFPHRNRNRKHPNSDVQFSMLVAVASFEDVSNLANGSDSLGNDTVCDATGFCTGAGAAVGVVGGCAANVGSTVYDAIITSRENFSQGVDTSTNFFQKLFHKVSIIQ